MELRTKRAFLKFLKGIGSQRGSSLKEASEDLSETTDGSQRNESHNSF